MHLYRPFGVFFYVLVSKRTVCSLREIRSVNISFIFPKAIRVCAEVIIFLPEFKWTSLWTKIAVHTCPTYYKVLGARHYLYPSMRGRGQFFRERGPNGNHEKVIRGDGNCQGRMLYQWIQVVSLEGIVKYIYVRVLTKQENHCKCRQGVIINIHKSK